MVGRRRLHASIATGLAVCLTGTAIGRNAEAANVPACLAADVVAADPGCHGAGPCAITRKFDVATGCVLDFGPRDVTVVAGGSLDIGEGNVSLKAASFTVAPSGLVDGRGTDIGGTFTVEATGDIRIQRAGAAVGAILLGGSGSGGGNAVLRAGGDLAVDGSVKADNGNGDGAIGGEIELRAHGSIVTGPASDVDAPGGLYAPGGTITVKAGGRVEIGSTVDARGGYGGSIEIGAGGEVVLGGSLRADGLNGDDGFGGTVDVVAGTRLVADGSIITDGAGADGGAVSLEAAFGDLVVRNVVSTKCGTSATAGSITLTARGSIDIQPSGRLVAEAPTDSSAGSIDLSADVDVLTAGQLRTSGGDAGGTVWIKAGRNASIGGVIDTQGRTFGELSWVAVSAAGQAPGTLTVTGTIITGSGGLGSDIDLEACDLTVAPSARLTASLSNVTLKARRQLTVLGRIDATGPAEDGSITLTHPSAVPPTVGSAGVAPAPTRDPRTQCSGGAGDLQDCLVPCPACGNGVTEFPETCDDVVGSPKSCDGCSMFCQVENCDDGNPCTVAAACDALLGCAPHVTVADGTPCPDATVCNGEEVCARGVCVAGTPLDCDDGKECTDDCDAVLGCVNVPRTGPCADDGDPCTTDLCDVARVTCVHTHVGTGDFCEDGEPCTVGDRCDDTGTCVPGSPLPDGSSCADGTVCNGNETCRGGVCQAGTALECDDGNPCTTSSCDPVLGCSPQVTLPDGASCADATLCNGNEVCTGGTCVRGVPLDCEDDNPCTDDRCDPATGCVHTPCFAPRCTCADATVCNGRELCLDGVCRKGTAPDCDDHNGCTTDACDAVLGCRNEPRPAGAACSDHDLCTLGDVCDGAGTCLRGRARCDDGNACTADACETTGECVHTPRAAGSSCDDGDACTVGDACDANGTCLAGGGRPSCDDGDPCTSDVCEGGACRHRSAGDGIPCEDGTACTVNDTCRGGVCTPGRLNDCSDGNACTDDGCDPARGCVHVPGTGSCDDGDPCTVADACADGACTGTVVGVSGVVCTLDALLVAPCAEEPLPAGIQRVFGATIGRARRLLGKAERMGASAAKERLRQRAADSLVTLAARAARAAARSGGPGRISGTCATRIAALVEERRQLVAGLRI